MKKFVTIVRPIKTLLYQQIHFYQIKLKMAANDMSNIHVSPDVLSILMLLQQVELYKLQQQILHGISRSSRPEIFCKKAAVKTYAKFTKQHLFWSLFLIKFQAFRSALQLYRKQTLILVFSCEFCEIFKNIYLEEHLVTTASASQILHSSKRHCGTRRRIYLNSNSKTKKFSLKLRSSFFLKLTPH